MNDNEIDEMLNRVRLPEDPAPETLARIAASLSASMHPVRPLPPSWILAGGVALTCALVALAGSAATGFGGFARMTTLDRGAVFSALLLLSLAAAGELVRAMIPGSRRRLSSGVLLIAISLGLAAVLAACFRDYHTTNFWHAGLVCLAIGVLHAIPAGLLSWWVLRRGFAVDPVSAGMAAGTLAGLAGVAMLELHCPNFQAAHVLVWHLAVVLVSAALGSLCGWASRLRRNQPLL